MICGMMYDCRQALPLEVIGCGIPMDQSNNLAFNSASRYVHSLESRVCCTHSNVTWCLLHMARCNLRAPAKHTFSGHRPVPLRNCHELLIFVPLFSVTLKTQATAYGNLKLIFPKICTIWLSGLFPNSIVGLN